MRTFAVCFLALFVCSTAHAADWHVDPDGRSYLAPCDYLKDAGRAQACSWSGADFVESYRRAMRGAFDDQVNVAEMFGGIVFSEPLSVVPDKRLACTWWLAALLGHPADVEPSLLKQAFVPCLWLSSDDFHLARSRALGIIAKNRDAPP